MSPPKLPLALLLPAVSVPVAVELFVTQAFAVVPLVANNPFAPCAVPLRSKVAGSPLPPIRIKIPAGLQGVIVALEAEARAAVVIGGGVHDVSPL